MYDIAHSHTSLNLLLVFRNAIARTELATIFIRYLSSTLSHQCSGMRCVMLCRVARLRSFRSYDLISSGYAGGLATLHRMDLGCLWDGSSENRKRNGPSTDRLVAIKLALPLATANHREDI